MIGFLCISNDIHLNILLFCIDFLFKHLLSHLFLHLNKITIHTLPPSSIFLFSLPSDCSRSSIFIQIRIYDFQIFFNTLIIR